MNRISIFLLVSAIVFLASCEKEPYINLGFDTRIDRYSNGLVIAHISGNYERFHLMGCISLFDGQAVVLLTDPDGVAVFTRTVVAPKVLQINETFDANPGNWKLEYKSSRGVGKINLHIFK